MKRRVISLVAGLGCALALTVGNAQAVTIGQADLTGSVLFSNDLGTLSGLFGGEAVTGWVQMDLDLLGGSTTLDSANNGNTPPNPVPDPNLYMGFDIWDLSGTTALYSYDSSLDPLSSLVVDFTGLQVSSIALTGSGFGGGAWLVEYNSVGAALTITEVNSLFSAVATLDLPSGNAYPVGTGVIPEPGTLLLLGTGLIGVASVRRRKAAAA